MNYKEVIKAKEILKEFEAQKEEKKNERRKKTLRYKLINDNWKDDKEGFYRLNLEILKSDLSLILSDFKWYNKKYGDQKWVQEYSGQIEKTRQRMFEVRMQIKNLKFL
jgi:hypothetical protein